MLFLARDTTWYALCTDTCAASIISTSTGLHSGTFQKGNLYNYHIWASDLTDLLNGGGTSNMVEVYFHKFWFTFEIWTVQFHLPHIEFQVIFIHYTCSCMSWSWENIQICQGLVLHLFALTPPASLHYIICALLF